MPIKRCKMKSGKPGYKFGNSGKCYSAKEQAEKQMKAMYANGYRGKGKK